MTGPFDDLIPAEPKIDGAFDDLIPKAPTTLRDDLAETNAIAKGFAGLPSREDANRARYQAQFGDTINADHEMRPVTTENVGDRTWSELFGDLGSRAHAGVRSGVAAMAEAPVNLLNVANRGAAMLPGSPTGLARDVLGLLGYQAPEAIPQPAPIADFAAQQRELAARDRADVSMKAGVQTDELAAAQGFLPTLKLLGMNPSMIPAEVAEVGGQMVPSIVPGGATAQVLSQAAQAGSMNAAQVRDTLIQQGMAPDEAERRATAAFASSTALNALLPFAHKGGTALERLLAGEAAQPGVGFVQRIATPTLGEGLTEAASGGGDQIIMNLATDRPVTEGVGSATALEGLLGAGTGAGVGTIDALRAAPVDAAVRADEARHSEALAALAQDRAAAALDPNRIAPQPVATVSPAARAEQFMADMRAAAPPPAAPTPNAAAPAPEPSARLRPDQSGAAATNPQPSVPPAGAVTPPAERPAAAPPPQPAPVAAAPATPAPQPTAPATAAPLTASAPAAPGPVQPVDRRQDTARRKAIEQMTPEEKDAAIAELRTQVETDNLTGLRNKASFEERQAAGETKPWKAAIDLSLFKHYNDEYGHGLGDAMLAAFGEALRNANPDGINSRTGGDEFTIEHDTEEGVNGAVNKLRQIAADTEVVWEHPDGRVVTVKGINFNAGIAEGHSDNADAALTSGKEQSGAPSARKGDVPSNVTVAKRGADAATGVQGEGNPNAGRQGAAPVAQPVVYHGTHLQFDKFQGNRTYFTSDPEIAAEYPKRPFGARVVESRLDMRNPLDFDAAGAEFGDIPLDRIPPEVVAALSESRSGVVPLRIVADAAEKLGYDGVIARNLVDSAGPISSERPSDVYVAFNPEQIRNAQEPAGPTAAPTEAAPEAPVADGSEPAPAGTPPAAETPPPAAAEPVAEKPEPTSVKNAVTEAEAVRDGVEKLVSEEGDTFRELWDKERATAASQPSRGQQLTVELLTNPRAATDAEHAALLHDRVRIFNELSAARAEVASTEGKTPAQQAQDILRLRDLEQQRRDNDLAARQSGSETGRGLNARKMLANLDYTLESVLQRAEVAAGKELAPTTKARIEALTKTIADLNQRIEALEKSKSGARRQTEKKSVDQRAQERLKKKIEALEGQIKQRLSACPI